MLSLIEQLVCLFQQAEYHGVSIIQTDPLEIQGPSKVVDRFAAVIYRLRAESEFCGAPTLTDRTIHLLWGSGGAGLQWERAFPDSPECWHLTNHDQDLLLNGLGQAVWVDDPDVRAGRLEGVAPGRCFLTPTPYIVAPDGVCSPAQLGVVSFPSWQVRLKPTDVHQESDSNDGGLAL